MNEPVWEFEYAVECNVPREFAWAYWTDAGNWDDPPAKFVFDGPFAVGTRLTTILPGQEFHSVIRDVREGRQALIEMELPGAVLAFRWTFEEMAGEKTRITQRLELSGEGAEALVRGAKTFEQTVPDGMKRLAGGIERKWHARK